MKACSQINNINFCGLHLPITITVDTFILVAPIFVHLGRLTFLWIFKKIVVLSWTAYM